MYAWGAFAQLTLKNCTSDWLREEDSKLNVLLLPQWMHRASVLRLRVNKDWEHEECDHFFISSSSLQQLKSEKFQLCWQIWGYLLYMALTEYLPFLTFCECKFKLMKGLANTNSISCSLSHLTCENISLSQFEFM